MTADNICRERQHILSPATIYSRRQIMSQQKSCQPHIVASGQRGERMSIVFSALSTLHALLKGEGHTVRFSGGPANWPSGKELGWMTKT